MHVLYELIGTVFFIGKIKRYGPTIVVFASSIIMYFWFVYKPNTIFPSFIILTFWGILASNYFIYKTNKDDPQEVVIDEFVGYVLAIMVYVVLAKHMTLLDAIFLAALFRVFDIVKLPPVRKIEKLPKGLGVMFDDLISGLYSGFIYFIIQWLNARLFQDIFFN